MKKRKGFSGERIIDIAILKEEPRPRLIFSKIGFFPNAKHQYNEGLEKKEYILLYCVEGIGEVSINGTKHFLNFGDFIIIPKGSIYIYNASKESPWSFYWFYFKDDTEFITKSLEFFYSYNSSFKGNLVYNEERIALFTAIFNNLNKGYSAANLTMLNMCLINFISALAFCTKPYQRINIQTKSKNRVEEAIEYMKKKAEGNVTLSELSKICSLSNSQFSHLFKEKTGISPLEYFNQLKIKKAARYLENTSLQIKEIAYKIGMQDAAYFSRLFTRIMGISPVKYRQKNNHR